MFIFQLDNEDTATEVPMLFDPSTKLFWDMIKLECILLGTCTILGLLWSFFLISRKRKSKVISTEGKFYVILDSRRFHSDTNLNQKG